MRSHARRHSAPSRLCVAAELLGVCLASLADRRHADDRHLTVLRQVGEMLLHAVLERGAAWLHHVGALRLDVRSASLRGRGGGEAEWVISRAALSAAMQVKVLISDVLQLQCARQRSGQKRRLFGPAFLDHDANGVNNLLAQADVAMVAHPVAREPASAWRRHVTRRRGAQRALQRAGAARPATPLPTLVSQARRLSRAPSASRSHARECGPWRRRPALRTR
jgi:hypothetical protein